MSSLTVSIVISLYNKEAYIGAALNSVLTQSFQDFEIIVVDDESNDAGPTIVHGFTDPRIRLHRQPNGGVSAARNAGLKLARHELVAFLDADDLWRPRHLERLMVLTERFPGAVIYGNAFIATDDATTMVIDKAVHYEQIEDYFSCWVAGPEPFHTSSSMARRTTALQLGGFPAGFHRGEDLAFFVNMALVGAVAVSNYVGCLYLRGPGGLTGAPVLAPDICMKTIRDLLGEPGRVGNGKRAALQEFANKIAVAHALDCVRAGYTKEALKFLELAAGTRAQRRRWWQARLLVNCPQPLRTLAFSIRELGR